MDAPSVFRAAITAWACICSEALTDATQLYTSSIGYGPPDSAIPIEKFEAMHQAYCTARCTANDVCLAAFFSSSGRLCLLTDVACNAWTQNSDWSTFVKTPEIGLEIPAQYLKVPGPALAPSGYALAQKYVFNRIINENHCQALCESVSASCDLFMLSSSNQCVIPGNSTITTSVAYKWDLPLRSYYKTVSVTLSASPTYFYKILPYDMSRATFITFNVTALSDAHVTLQPNGYTRGNVSNAYEIPIGGWSNTKTCIRKQFQGALLACVAGTFLSPVMPRQFWISWAGGIIKFGTGSTVGESMALSYNDSSPYPVNAVGISAFYSVGSDWSLTLPFAG